MRVEWNERTEQKLAERMGDHPGYFKLFYDVQECGCNGVLVLQIVNKPYPTDLPVEAVRFSVVVDAKQESLFDQVMRLEADVSYPTFKLTSDSGILSSNISVADTRQAVESK